MSNRYYVGRKTASLNKSPALEPFTKVVIVVGNDEETGEQIIYEAGNDTGRTLEVTNPWGTQQIANDILAQISGYRYRPFNAQDAILSDDAELGDAVTMSDVYGVIVKQEVIFDGLGTTSISAPNSDETDNEFGNYTSRSERAIARRFTGISTRLTVEVGRIEASIEDTAEGLSTKIEMTKNSIISTVAATYETKRDAEMTRTQLNSKIEQTAENIISTVAATYETKTAAGQMQTQLESKIEQKANSIISTVAATYETISGSKTRVSSAISQFANSISLSVSGTNGTTTFKIDGNGATLDTETFDLHVKAVNVEGTITADSVKANTSISSPKIIGGRFWDENEEASFYINYDRGIGNVMYGAGAISNLASAYFGINGDYVDTRVALYLAGREAIAASFSVDSLWIEQPLFLNKRLILSSDCFGDSLPYEATYGRIFFVKG